MTALSRRMFMTGVAAVPLAATAVSLRVERMGRPALLYDESLSAGRRFAIRASSLGGEAIPLAGDRVRQMVAMLHDAPSALFGVTRHSDELLIGEIAREAGCRRMALVQHRADGNVLSQCGGEGAMIGTLARLAGGRWPEAFAEFALGGVERCRPAGSPDQPEQAISWVLAKPG